MELALPTELQIAARRLKQIENKVLSVRKALCDADDREKKQRNKLKSDRSFEIYDFLPFKFQHKLFTYGEKHPLSKDRFETCNNLILSLQQ